MTAPDAQSHPGNQSVRGAGAPSSDHPTVGPKSKAPAGDRKLSREQPKWEATASRFPAAPDLSGFHELRVWAESYEDALDHRKRLCNRLGYKADGTEQKSGARVPRDLFESLLAPMKDQERIIKLAMRRCYRRIVPPEVRTWQQSTFGIGEHLLARLLGTLGHPRIATPYHWEGDGEDRKLIPDLAFERSLHQLWAYCGHGDVTRKKRKGMSVEDAFGLGSPRCKMLVHLLAEASMKCRIEPTACAANPNSDRPIRQLLHAVARDTSADQPMPQAQALPRPADRQFRVVYEQRRALTATTHPDWTDGHSHNDALRIVGKEILRSLWAAAR